MKELRKENIDVKEPWSLMAKGQRAPANKNHMLGSMVKRFKAPVQINVNWAYQEIKGFEYMELEKAHAAA